MKAKRTITSLCVLALLLSTFTPVLASGNSDPASVVVDVVIARPLTFAMSILGSALFVVSLPVSVPSGSVKKTAQTLVVGPFNDTFGRPVGDLDDFMDY